MAKTAVLSVKILSDARKAVDGMNQTSKAAGLMKKAIAVVGLAAAGAKVIQFGRDSVNAAADLQQSAGAVDVVFGKSATKMGKWSSQAALSVGLAKNEYNELGTLIGTQLKNGGTAMDDLAPKTNKLIGLGADLASMFGGTSKEAVEALSSALKGERDPIEKYGVSLNQARIDAKAAELGFSKVGGALSAEANQAATLAIIMNQTADAHGNFAKESNTLQGQQQRVAAQWQNIKAAVGTAFLPVLTTAFSFISATVLPVLATFADQLAEGGLGGALGGLAPIIGTLLTTFSPLSLILQALTPVLPQIGEMLGLIAGAGAQVVGALMPLAQQVLGAIIPLFVQLASGVLPPVVTAITSVVSAVLPLVTTLLGLLVPAIQFLLPIVVSIFSGIVSNVVGAVEGIVQVITGVVSLITALFTGDWAAAWDALKSIVGGAVKAVVNLVQLWIVGKMFGAAKGVLTGLRGFFSSAWGSIVATVKGAASSVFGAVRSGLNSARSTVYSVIGRIRSFITNGFRGAVNSVRSAMSRFRSAVSTGISNVLGYVRRIPGRITSALGSMGNLLKRAGRAVIDGFLGGLTGAFGKVQDFVGGIGSWIVDNKGPLSYDKKMLQPAGKAIMGGLVGSMRASMPDLMGTVADVNGALLTAGGVAPRFTLGRNGGGPRTEVYQDNRKIEVRAGVGDAIAIGREVEKYSRRYDGARGTK
ncbi:hypothetical protein ACHABX_02650 [Nesterenkonia halotolerans]|uniref:phage tail protein n=1 Tax=Nesterenkonia halotolerans TaxID=225325 RepID=UPI003EE72148